MGTAKPIDLNPLEKALFRLQAQRSKAVRGEGTAGPSGEPKGSPSRTDIQDYVREVREAIGSLAEDIRAYNPQYAELVPHIRVTAARKSGGSGRVVRAIVEEILSQDGARKTQKAIRENVEAKLGERVFKDWTVPLPPWARARFEKLIAQAGAPFTSIPVAQVRTLSDLWRYARVAVMNANGEAFRLRTTVRISEGHVFIGDSTFKISLNKANGYEYKQIRVRVDELLRLVSPAH